MEIEELQDLLDICPFARFLGFKIMECDKDEQSIEMHMTMRAELARVDDSDHIHGGPIACLIDTAADYALVALTSILVPTLNLRVDYLRPAEGSFLKAIAIVRKAGRSIGVVDVDVVNSNGQLIAIGRGCFAMPLKTE